MKVVDKKPVPIYETTCPECKSVIEYIASEVSFTGYITCPVCGMSTWASIIKPVRYEDGYVLKTDTRPVDDWLAYTLDDVIDTASTIIETEEEI